ncbi:2-oxo-4-hydroxy-4-carboxy-5-ureidoimidazoline decarboxylase [Streptomyces sp. NPDC002536]
MTPSSTPSTLGRFNAADDATALAALHTVCASDAWGKEILAGRPYPDAEALFVASDTAVARLGTAGLAEALAGHPPIGRPKPGDPDSSREQRGMAGAPAGLRAEMLALNLAYQEKFGHVFLICATGRSAEEMRDAVRHRIDNPPQHEREIVREELAKINRLRLARLAGPEGATVSTHILDTAAGRPAAGVAVALSVRDGRDTDWQLLGTSATDPDGRCKDLPALPAAAAHARLVFATEPCGAGFFPEVAVAFAVAPGEHYHVPLLLSPFGFSVYRGS